MSLNSSGASVPSNSVGVHADLVLRSQVIWVEPGVHFVEGHR